MLISILYPDELQFRLEEAKIENEIINISVTCTNQRAVCPHCQTVSERIHSYYPRHPADVPFAGDNVHLYIAVPRFFCDNGVCQARTFADRMSALIEPYAHRTNRLAEQQQHVAFALGGEAGERLLAVIGMKVSSDTLIRLIRKAPEPDVTAPRVLGVDDWAKRKGRTYGTILVDLETHQPIDLLPDRTAESFAKWLKEHPGVEIISRDRGVEYISGANEGAPDAIQVADRWHLLDNYQDALKRLMESKHACLVAAVNESNQDGAEQNLDDIVSLPTTKSSEVPPETPPNVTKVEGQIQERRNKRQKRFESVKELHKLGLSKSDISRHLDLNWRTVDKYIRVYECPSYAGGLKGLSILDPYMDYMIKRWNEGCHNATHLWHEIQDLGFRGSRRIVGEWATKIRSSVVDRVTKKNAPLSASSAAWLLVKQEEDLTAEDKQSLERIKQSDEDVAEAYALSQRFTTIVRERQHGSLLDWLDDVIKSGIRALKGFVKGIKQDLAAVINALSLPWSNGQTEGQVNRLKLIKRQMYGRAKFDLLRKRVIGNLLRC
jgi:transposase